MVTILYTYLQQMTDPAPDELIAALPAFIQQEILRYREVNDRKARMMARLMLHACLEKEGKTAWLHRWKKDERGKPFIPGWKPFSISHSGNLVVFSYSDRVTGVDVEKKVTVEYLELMKYFHPQEQAAIRSAADVQHQFFEIWVKKEALLKAIGTGIVNSLHEFCCIPDKVVYQQQQWHLQQIDLGPDYLAYLCSPEENETVRLIQYSPLSWQE